MLITLASSALMSVRDFAFESCAIAGDASAAATNAASTVRLMCSAPLSCPHHVLQDVFRYLAAS
jgi:hypothetical protein